MQKACTGVLHGRRRPPAASSEQRMLNRDKPGSFSHFAEHRQRWCEDQLRVPAQSRLAQPKELAASDEQDLIGITDHVVASDMPNEYAAVGKRYLELRREVFGRMARTQTARDVLDDPAWCAEQLDASHVSHGIIPASV